MLARMAIICSLLNRFRFTSGSPNRGHVNGYGAFVNRTGNLGGLRV
jgi:hypothetical protein